jgi:hypothetical protein
MWAEQKRLERVSGRPDRRQGTIAWLSLDKPYA